MAIYKTQIKITKLQIKPKKQGDDSICCSELDHQLPSITGIFSHSDSPSL